VSSNQKYLHLIGDSHNDDAPLGVDADGWGSMSQEQRKELVSEVARNIYDEHDLTLFKVIQDSED
jgi:hypothetical protein